MNKIVLVLSSLLLAFTGACSQIPGLTPTPGTGPTLDPESQFQTAVAQTLTSRPPDTALPSPSPVVAATETPGLETPVPLDTQQFLDEQLRGRQPLLHGHRQQQGCHYREHAFHKKSP